MKKRTVLFHIFLILVITFLIYSNVLEGKFLFDDEHFILRNVYITDFKYIKEIFTQNITRGAGFKDNFYRPLSTFLWLIINKIFGLNNIVFHILNVLVHTICSILVYLILLKFFNNKYNICLIGSLYFAVHPIQTEAVSYISGLGDPLSFMFLLLSIYLYIIVREGKSLRLIFIFIISVVLSILAKERGLVVLPLIFLVEIFYVLKEKIKKEKIDKELLAHRRKWYFITYIFLVMICGLWFYLRVTEFNFDSTFNFYKQQNIYSSNVLVRIYTFLNVLLTYLKLILIPYPLYMERTSPIFVSILNIGPITGLLILLISFIFSLSKIKNEPLYMFIFLWFLIALLPTSGIIPINSIIMEHWLYFSMFAIAVLVTYLCDKNIYIKWIVIVLIFIYSAMTYAQNFIWQEPYTFFGHILKYNPDSIAANNNFAMAAVDKGDIDKAIFHYKKSILLSDIYPQPHHNLARIYVSLGDLETAIYEYKQALKLDPDFVYTHIDLYNIFTQLGKKQEAEFHRKKVEEILKK